MTTVNPWMLYGKLKKKNLTESHIQWILHELLTNTSKDDLVYLIDHMHYHLIMWTKKNRYHTMDIIDEYCYRVSYGIAKLIVKHSNDNVVYTKDDSQLTCIDIMLMMLVGIIWYTCYLCM